MRAKLVSEYLYVDSHYENQLFESINEGFDIEKIKSIIPKIKDKKKVFINLIKKFNKENNINAKKILGITIIAFYLISFISKNNKWAASIEYHKNIEKAGIELAQKEEINIQDIKDAVDFEEKVRNDTREIFSTSEKGLIDDINSIINNRLSDKNVHQYDKYDVEILEAVKELKEKGENADANLIKAIMLIETGMNPRKNHLGFEGFPQTKNHIINGWTDKDGKFHPGINQRYGTDFTIKDMYDPKEAAKFIHYYTKSLQKSKYVKDLEDLIIAYNWGTGNLGKYKRGESKLPSESYNYVKMTKALQKYFS